MASTALSVGAALEDATNPVRKLLTELAVEVANEREGEFVLKVSST